jgi:hypothetical protein
MLLSYPWRHKCDRVEDEIRRAPQLDSLKRLAKDSIKTARQATPDADVRLGHQLNALAKDLGWEDWRLLLKSHHSQPTDWKAKILQVAARRSDVREALIEIAPLNWNAAVAELDNFVRVHYVPLIDFAFYDSERENGYTEESVDLHEELRDHFSDRFPERIIAATARRLEEEGPWGSVDWDDEVDEAK